MQAATAENGHGIDQLEHEIIDGIKAAAGGGGSGGDASPPPIPAAVGAEPNDQPIRYLVDGSGSVRLSRPPKNEQEWRDLFLDAYEDGDEIFHDDPFARASGCTTYQQKYTWLRDQQNKLLDRDKYHVRCQMHVYRDHIQQDKLVAQPFQRTTVLGLTDQYAVMAATFKPVDPEAEKRAKMTAKQQLAMPAPKFIEDKNFYLFRCSIITPEVKTETVIMNTAYSRNENPGTRKDSTKPFEVKTEGVSPAWEAILDREGSMIKLGSKIVQHHLTARGTLALVLEEKEPDSVFIYNVHVPLRVDPRLGKIRLQLPGMIPDLLCCNDGASVIAVAFNKAPGWVGSGNGNGGDGAAAAAASKSQPTAMDTDGSDNKPSVHLPPHVRLYFRDIFAGGGRLLHEPITYVPLTPVFYRKRVLELKGQTNTEEYRNLGITKSSETVSSEYINNLAFHDQLQTVFYVCAGDGSIHVLQLQLETGAYQLGEHPMFLAPSPEEEVAAQKEEQKRAIAAGEKEPILPGDSIHANKAREPIWTLLFRTVGHGDRQEPRVVATSYCNLYVQLGLPRDFELKISRGKKPEQLFREIGTCVSASTCGNILALHRANNTVDIGSLSSPHTCSPSRFDQPSVIAEMPLGQHVYSSLRVFSNRVVVLWTTGMLGFFLTNDAEFQKKYDEEKTKALDARQKEAKERREKIEEEALLEKIKALQLERKRKEQESVMRAADSAGAGATPVMRDTDLPHAPADATGAAAEAPVDSHHKLPTNEEEQEGDG